MKEFQEIKKIQHKIDEIKKEAFLDPLLDMVGVHLESPQAFLIKMAAFPFYPLHIWVKKSRIKSLDKKIGAIKSTTLGKIATQFEATQHKINVLKADIKTYQQKIQYLKESMKPTLPAAKLAEGQADIEAWQQKIKNIEIEIACFEELALNWQGQYDTEVFDQNRKVLNADDKAHSIQNLAQTNDIEQQTDELVLGQDIEKIQKELHQYSDNSVFDKLVSMELDKENQKKLEDLLGILKKINKKY